MRDKHYSWLIDPRTGDYDIANGDPQRDETLRFPAYVRLRLASGSWLYAPDASYGSVFGTVKKRTTNSITLLSQIAEAALAPLIDDGRAVTVAVDPVSSGRNSEEMAITITERDGELTQFQLNPVGT
jgi:phage gp46-like protein